jgi:hypothetical protein
MESSELVTPIPDGVMETSTGSDATPPEAMSGSGSESVAPEVTTSEVSPASMTGETVSPEAAAESSVISVPAPAAESAPEPISLLEWLVPSVHAQTLPETATLTGARLRVSDMVVTSSGSGTLRIFSGAIAADADTVRVFSGSYTASGVAARPVYDASFPVLSGSLSREKTAPELVDALTARLLPYRPLPSDVRDSLLAYLSTDNSGATIVPHPAVNSYANARLRGLVALVLSQPEYLMVSGYDRASVSADAGGASPLSSARGKLVIVQMYGGYDWLHGVIPKADYDLFARGRTTVTNGTIATDLSRLIDLGDYYLSSDFAPYAPYALSGDLKIFNGVGGAWHSSDHNAAQHQMTSFSDTTDIFDDGIVGRLAMNERDSSKVVALDAGSPDLYRSGNHISI